jgi:hypothetical protein
MMGLRGAGRSEQHFVSFSCTSKWPCDQTRMSAAPFLCQSGLSGMCPGNHESHHARAARKLKAGSPL